MSDENKNQTLTTPEQITLKRKGTSDFLRVPAKWRKSIKGLQGPLIFDATLKRDESGVIYIVFKKVNNNKGGIRNE